MADGKTEKSALEKLIEIASGANNFPKMDFVGPTVDDDIRRAIWRYGAESVRLAVKEATKPKRGRKPEEDWPELREIFQADAREWLAGGDPFERRSNYSIAKELSKINPGHDPVSTHKRIERKLSKKRGDRKWWTLVFAEIFGLKESPYSAYLRTLEALVKLTEADSSATWQGKYKRACAVVKEYTMREGQEPSAEMTFQQVDKAVQEMTRSVFLTSPNPTGVLGARLGFSSPLGSILKDALDPEME